MMKRARRAATQLRMQKTIQKMMQKITKEKTLNERDPHRRAHHSSARRRDRAWSSRELLSRALHRDAARDPARARLLHSSLGAPRRGARRAHAFSGRGALF